MVVVPLRKLCHYLPFFRLSFKSGFIFPSLTLVWMVQSMVIFEGEEVNQI